MSETLRAPDRCWPSHRQNGMYPATSTTSFVGEDVVKWRIRLDRRRILWHHQKQAGCSRTWSKYRDAFATCNVYHVDATTTPPSLFRIQPRRPRACPPHTDALGRFNASSERRHRLRRREFADIRSNLHVFLVRG